MARKLVSRNELNERCALKLDPIVFTHVCVHVFKHFVLNMQRDLGRCGKGFLVECSNLALQGNMRAQSKQILKELRALFRTDNSAVTMPVQVGGITASSQTPPGWDLA